MNNERVKVLYIAGNGRSGSTLLGVLLGQLGGFFAGGELRRIWDRGVIENRVCGCGAPFAECPTWQAIFADAFGGLNSAQAQAMVGHRERLTQTKHLPGMIASRGNRSPGSAAERDFLGALDGLYRSIGRVTGCRVIVDASKWPMYACMLDRVPAVEVYILHLTRDPRAVAFSWTRRKQYEAGQPMPRQSALKSTLYWLAWNPAITFLWKRPAGRYLLFPYEQFVRQPQQALADIARFVGEDPGTLPFTGPQTLNLQKTHAVAGNEARLASGPITLKPDDEWRTKLSRFDRALVTLMTWPLLQQYGYTDSGRA